MTPSPYDALIEQLQAFEERPYAIRMSNRMWAAIQRDTRSRLVTTNIPGDPPLFMKIPVRVDSKRSMGEVRHPQVFATALDLHEALYPSD